MKKNERIDLLLEVIADTRRIGTLHHAAATQAEKRALTAEAELATVKASLKKETDERLAREREALTNPSRIAALESACEKLRADVLEMEDQRDAAVKELEHVKGIVLAPAAAWDNSKAAEAAQVRIVELEGQMRLAVEVSLSVGAEIARAAGSKTLAEIIQGEHGGWTKETTDAILAHIGAAPASPALFKVGDRVRCIKGGYTGTEGEIIQEKLGCFKIRTHGADTIGFVSPGELQLLSPQ